MSRQLSFTLIACGLAGLVLAATIIFSPKLPEAPGDAPLSPDDDARYGGVDPSHPGPKIDELNRHAIGGVGAEVGKLYIRRVDPKRRRITIFMGDRVQPRPNGVSEVANPRAILHLVPGRRVFEITGRQGTLIAPDNNPESGVLSGGVVLSLYDAPQDQTVIIAPDSPHTALRVFLDEEVRFDLLLGLVESAGPVHLSTPRVDFQGAGLNLMFNEAQRRINRLEIIQGRQLRFNPNELKPRDPSKESNRAASGRESKKPDETPTKAPADAPPQLAERDYYQATFDEQVVIVNPEATITASKLRVLFSFGQQQEGDDLLDELSGAPMEGSQPRAMRGVAAPPRASSATAITTAAPAEARAPAARSLAAPTKEDIIVTWTGSMIVEPLAEKPQQLTGPDDSQIVLHGPVQVKTARQETVIAHLIEYLTGSESVRMVGSPQTPLVIHSRKLGQLTAPELEVNQQTGQGRITGAGAIIADERPVGVEAKAGAEKPAHDSLPPGLAVRWSQGVELAFYADKSAPARDKNTKKAEAARGAVNIRPTSNLDALRVATFNGGVKVDHPQFDLRSQTMAIHLPPPAVNDKAGAKPAPDDPPRLSQVYARGGVHAVARGGEKQPPIDIAADELHVTFRMDGDNRAQPQRFVAEHNVRTVQPGRVLHAGLLDVTLADAPPKPARDASDAAKKGDKKDRLIIKAMTAARDVRIDVEKPPTKVAALRLDADMAEGKVSLWGDDHRPARVDRQDNSLAGKHIIMLDKDQLIHVIGPGEAEFETATVARKGAVAAADTDQPADDQAAQEQPAEKEPVKKEPQRMTVAWSKQMTFNNSTGHGRFIGDVVATSARKLDVTRFHADDLSLQVSPDAGGGESLKNLLDTGKSEEKTGIIDAPRPSGDAEAGADAQAEADPRTADANDKIANEENASGAKEQKKPDRSVQKIHARGNVTFEAQEWQDRIGGTLATRFRLRGPLLIFDHASEQLHIVGKGSMQIEDYREKRKAQAGGKPAAPGDAENPIAFVGRGVTLFDWRKGLVLDASRNDVRMEQDVQMIQLAAGEQEPVQMDCQHLVADFASGGGLDVWLSGDAPEPKLENVIAVERVRLIQKNQTVTADRLEYNGSKQVVVLSAEPGRFCTLEDPQSILPAKRFRWHLENDKMIAEEPGAVRRKLER